MLKAISESRFSECLSITTEYLANRNIAALQQEWIHLTASLGLHTTFKSRLAWNDVNSQLYTILQAPKVHVKDALSLTAKLCLLCKRHSGVYSQEPLQKMKARVTELIPDTSKLNYTGFNTFSRIVPGPTEDNAIFYGRVLAALSKLATEEDAEGLRFCFEYLSRKKFKLPLPNEWPAPSAKDNGDPDWFLWGFLLSFYKDTPSYQCLETMYNIYIYDSDKSQKLMRQGLLWGAIFAIPKADQYDYVWLKEEMKVLQQVEKMSVEMWREHTKTKPRDILTSFVARGYVASSQDATHNIQHDEQELRQIKISHRDKNKM